MNATKRIRVAMTAVAALLGWAGVPAGAYDYWHTWVVDQDGDVGRYCSLAILPSGPPCISYFDATSSTLKYTQCDGYNWQPTVVDQASMQHYPGSYTSLAILLSGEPAISYIVTTDVLPSGQLWYATRVGNVWQTERVSGSGAYAHTSLVILPSGYPAISCHQWWVSATRGGNLWYVEYDGTEWQWTPVDNFTAEDVGQYSSLAMQPTGDPAISYYDASNGDLRFAYRTSYGDWVYHLVDGNDPPCDVGQYTSLTFFPPDHPTLPGCPAISYYDVTHKSLKFAWYDPNDPNSSGWNTVTVHSDAPLYDVGRWTSLAITPDGQPAISYCKDYLSGTRHNQGLYYAVHVDDNLAENWQIEDVEVSVDEVGHYTSLAILPPGHPTLAGVSAISSYDATNQILKYALRHYCIGDLNCDGTISFGDINPFVLRLSNPPGYQQQFPGCPDANGDINGDGSVNFGDINPFVSLMVQCGGGCACPGPITANCPP